MTEPNALCPHSSLDEEISKTVLLAGRLLMESGAETQRVESTTGYLLSKSLENDPRDYDLYVLLNALFVRIGTFKTSFQQVSKRGNNLGRISAVNQISRDYTCDHITLAETHQRLIDVENNLFSPLSPLPILASALLGGSVVFLYGGKPIDFFPALCAGLTSYVTYHLSSRVLNVPFASEFFGTLLGGFVAFLLSSFFGVSFTLATIGAVIPLVPGIALANATRDLMDRHYVTGTIRFVECFCSAGALGGGIAAVYFLLM